MKRCEGRNLDNSECGVWLKKGSDCRRHVKGAFPAVVNVDSMNLGAHADMQPFASPTVRAVQKPDRTIPCCPDHEMSHDGQLHVTEGAAWIFDMDGTLVDVTEAAERNNMHAPEKKDRNFPGFMADGQISPPNRDIVKLAQDVHLAGGKVVVMTAREGWWGRASIWWLREQEVPYDGFFHRAKQDFRPDGVTKTELLGDARRAGFNIEHAVDDNPPVVDVWCSHGIPTSVVPADRWQATHGR